MGYFRKLDSVLCVCIICYCILGLNQTSYKVVHVIAILQLVSSSTWIIQIYIYWFRKLPSQRKKFAWISKNSNVITIFHDSKRITKAKRKLQQVLKHCTLQWKQSFFLPTACEFIFQDKELPGFKCAEINWCIPKQHLCNSVPNCPQGSDEDASLCKSEYHFFSSCFHLIDRSKQYKFQMEI